MARFPVVDDPCPLPQHELAGIAGQCAVCGKTVHTLDGMDDAERSALMSQAKGSICVVYRLPLRIGAALALSLATPAYPQSTSAAGAEAPCDTQAAPEPEQSKVATQEIIVTGGTVRQPADAAWVEDMSLPELPTASDDTTPAK